MTLLTCPECGRGCKNLSGLTRHKNAAHTHDLGLTLLVTELRRVYHPQLHGTYSFTFKIPHSYHSFKGQRCDRHGALLPPNSLPEPPSTHASDDWFPFTSCAGFELADFLFTEAELSQKKITEFLNFGPPLSFPIMKFHPLPTTSTSTSRSMQLNSETSSGKIPPSNTTALSQQRLALPSGRPRNTMFGTETHVKSSRIS